MTALVTQGLGVRRGGRAILADLDLTFAGGELVAVVGPNGAGKSTLLAALAGLLRPSAGEVSLDGRALKRWDRRALAHRRAYLPQGARAEWPLPVERLVTLGLTPQLPAFGPLPLAMREQVAAAMRACDVEALAQRTATSLSGGELARAMLARCLVGEPEVLIVDEPMAGLDPRHALDAMTRLRGLADGGKLVVAAVHDLTLAARFATRLIALKDGRLAADGPLASTLTAELVRDVFDIEAEVSGKGGRARVDFLGPHVRPDA